MQNKFAPADLARGLRGVRQNDANADGQLVFKLRERVFPADAARGDTVRRFRHRDAFLRFCRRDAFRRRRRRFYFFRRDRLTRRDWRRIYGIVLRRSRRFLYQRRRRRHRDIPLFRPGRGGSLRGSGRARRRDLSAAGELRETKLRLQARIARFAQQCLVLLQRIEKPEKVSVARADIAQNVFPVSSGDQRPPALRGETEQQRVAEEPGELAEQRRRILAVLPE